MTLDERARELQDQFPGEGLTLGQCRVATYMQDFGWCWLGVSDGLIDLSRDLGEYNETISIRKSGCWK